VPVVVVAEAQVERMADDAVEDARVEEVRTLVPVAGRRADDEMEVHVD
jgi:hypothetical protein